MVKINSLVELAQAIEAGEEFEIKNVQGNWVNYTKHDDPTEVSLVGSFVCGIPLRIKPPTKVIDMTPFIENGLDCIFTNPTEFVSDRDFIGPLRNMGNDSAVGRFYDDHTGRHFKCCQPRLNHPFIWENQELPEGLDVVYRYFDCDGVGLNNWTRCFDPNDNTLVLARIVGCKEGYKFPDGGE